MALQESAEDYLVRLFEDAYAPPPLSLSDTYKHFPNSTSFPNACANPFH